MMEKFKIVAQQCECTLCPWPIDKNSSGGQFYIMCIFPQLKKKAIKENFHSVRMGYRRVLIAKLVRSHGV